ncbi:MAG: hypothetical protein ACRDFS_11565 [Chloroflexota bacterium]
MATLRDMLVTINGFYREPEADRGLPGSELLARLPIEVLDEEIAIERRQEGIFTVSVAGGPEYEVLSRRRNRRS